MSKILIVEDEETIADLEKDYLELSGFEVEVANDGETGLEKALKDEYSLFILDLMLSPGDRILAQEPLSPDVHRTIKLAGGKLITVPVDEDGMICDNLEAIIESEHPRFIYVDSSFSNPTGAFLTIERRRKLLELSYR